MQEPDITINGTKLTVAQAMTERVALTEFLAALADGLGDDDHGRAMTNGYREALADIYRLIMR